MKGSGKLLIFFSLSFAFVTPSAYGWGADGHRLICRIAQNMLTPEAAAKVRALLPANVALETRCSWADSPFVKLFHPGTAPLHYINIKDPKHHPCPSYSSTRDCAGGICVEGGIEDYAAKLINTSLTHNIRHEALLFLSHFIGDIHQPLHVGFATDKGGNQINVHWFEDTNNKIERLHNVWDTRLVKYAINQRTNGNLTLFTELIEQNYINSQSVARWEHCATGVAPCPKTYVAQNNRTTYAAESIALACQYAYAGVVQPGSLITSTYAITRQDTVEEQLAKAGVHLAATLNEMFK